MRCSHNIDFERHNAHDTILTMQVNPTIFREYDIRGITGHKFSKEAMAEYEKWYGPFPGITITLEAAEAIGNAYGSLIRKEGGKRIVVGHEIRPFAEELKAAFIAGVRKTGCDVADLGVSLTPIVYFTIAYAHYDGGVNITGSHNVYFYNGFKLMKKDVWPMFGEALQEMRRMIELEKFTSAPKPGNYEVIDGYLDYKKYFVEHIKLVKKPHVVIDCGNGSAGVFAPDLFRALGAEVTELYTTPDATFPNHLPDPEQRQYLTELAKTVVREKADFGIAFDADGDRVGFVDEHGEFIEADYVLLLLAKDALSRHPGKKILFDTKCSQLLLELIPIFGGIPLMHRTGHAPIKETFRKDADIIFGGERSGHIFFAEDYFKIDDGLYAGARLLELFSKQGGSFSSLFAPFPRRVLTPEYKLPCKDEKKFEIMRQIQKDLGGKYPSVLIDGVRINVTPTGWGLIRASNTSPYLTVCGEGVTEEEVIRVKNILADELEKFPEITDRLNRKEVATLTGKLGWV